MMITYIRCTFGPWGCLWVSPHCVHSWYLPRFKPSLAMPYHNHNMPLSACSWPCTLDTWSNSLTHRTCANKRLTSKGVGGSDGHNITDTPVVNIVLQASSITVGSRAKEQSSRATGSIFEDVSLMTWRQWHSTNSTHWEIDVCRVSNNFKVLQGCNLSPPPLSWHISCMSCLLSNPYTRTKCEHPFHMHIYQAPLHAMFFVVFTFSKFSTVLIVPSAPVLESKATKGSACTSNQIHQACQYRAASWMHRIWERTYSHSARSLHLRSW